jgi:hypothetical protein
VLRMQGESCVFQMHESVEEASTSKVLSLLPLPSFPPESPSLPPSPTSLALPVSLPPFVSLPPVLLVAVSSPLWAESRHTKPERQQCGRQGARWRKSKCSSPAHMRALYAGSADARARLL